MLYMGSTAARLEAFRRGRSATESAFGVTLAGVAGVRVLVEPINPNAERHAFARA